jgi:hypothetical protein
MTNEKQVSSKQRKKVKRYKDVPKSSSQTSGVWGIGMDRRSGRYIWSMEEKTNSKCVNLEP